MSGDIFVPTGKGGGGDGEGVLLASSRNRPECCWTRYNTQGSPRSKELLAQNVKSAKVEKF